MTVSRWTARRYFHCLRRTITRITDKIMTVMCYYNPWHRSRRFINKYFRLTDQNAKLFTRNHDMCFAEKSARMRPGCSRWSAAWSKHWRQCVWLTCPTRTRDTLASRCSKRAARKLPRCGTGDRAKNTYCELSSFGPALFEIWWPDIYLGGPYGPVTDKMYWPELVRRSEKCAGPVLMSRAGKDLCHRADVKFRTKKWFVKCVLKQS